MNRQNKHSHIYRISIASRIAWSIALFLLFPGLMAAQAPEAAQNFQRFLKSVASPDTILVPGTSAALSQFVFRPAGFESGAEGYGHHFGVALADNVDGKFIRDFAFPTLFRQDVAYVSDHAPATVWRRVGHVLMHSVLLDTKDHRLNFSGLPASFASAGASNFWQPREQRTWAATFQRSATNAGGYLVGDLASEFKPEVCVVRKWLHIAC